MPVYLPDTALLGLQDCPSGSFEEVADLNRVMYPPCKAKLPLHSPPLFSAPCDGATLLEGRGRIEMRSIGQRHFAFIDGLLLDSGDLVLGQIPGSSSWILPTAW